MTTKPQPEALPVPTDDALRAMWRAAGGKFHGPIVETGTMPEALLLPFLRSIFAAPATEHAARLHAECEALRADRDSWERQCSDRVDDAVEFLRQRDEARAECEALRAALNAACAFIDCHVADWDLTKEMVSHHADFVKARAELAARAAKEQA